MAIVADCIDQVLRAIDTDALESTIESVKAQVAELTGKYPLPYCLLEFPVLQSIGHRFGLPS